MSARLFDLGGRIALVTGSTSGIGLALARGLAEAGARIVVNGRHQGRVDETVAGLRRDGLDAHGVSFDVTVAERVAEGVTRIEAEVGPVDILVNNAGIQRRKAILDLEEEVWEEVLRGNLTSVFLVTRAIARGMVERRQGKIINICSLTSEVARKTIAPYAASKGALRQLTKAMCVEWAGQGIQVNGIGPGYFVTPLNKALLEDQTFDRWVRERTPAGRWGQPDELVGTAVFLASPASDFVNGQIIYVDGGLLAAI